MVILAAYVNANIIIVGDWNSNIIHEVNFKRNSFMGLIPHITPIPTHSKG